jgi:homocysteine S-methyltransferase
MRANTFPQLKAMLNQAQRLATVGVDMFDVPDNAGATVNIGTIGTAFRLQQVTNIPTLIHWTTRQRNLISIQSHLLEAWALGIQGVIALSGDHPKVGRYETAKVVTDLRGSVQLMALIERLNQGYLIDGSSLGEACNFYVGGGLTVAPNLSPHLKHLRQKVENGARYVYTQPVSTLDDAEKICHATRNFGIKVLLGILPITSFRSISFLRDNLGMYIPLTVVDRFQSLSSTEDQATYGLEMINDFVYQLSRQDRFPVDGIYVIPPARINWKRKQAIISQLIRTFRSQV